MLQCPALALETNFNYLAGGDLQAPDLAKLAADLEQFSRAFESERAVEVYSTPCMRSRRFRAVSLGRYQPKRGRRKVIELSVAIILRTLRGLQRLCVKFEAAESILAYRFVGGRIEEINKHEFFRVSCKII